ncbi:MAG TPA: rhomboid family intramembrane serine protease [Arenimonas sp.]|uniref:rhomboid family intramembrane serine protease n=1 Tax=Arenimonas sp. TaxID=1872635 RepID=UPI002C59CC8D|nr:rhomboid family intramembrane serine protease [Arenimonas sp.]HMB56533.1 rhomboid family intramembrane serine protease [Arenimonas sp.]
MSSTLIIIAITCAISFLAFNQTSMREALILWPPAISRDNDWYRLVSYGLIHADFQHLFFNMLTLYFFGRAVEPFYDQRLGELGFVLFYVLGLILSILPSYLKNRGNSEYRSLGASGAVSAVLFAFILRDPWSSIYLYMAIKIPAIVFAVLYTAYSIYMDRRGKDNVNHSAHLWGAAYGVVFTVLIDPKVLSAFFLQLSHPRF